MSTLTQYQIYCITEGTFVQQWAYAPISKCPNDTNHTVNSASISSLQTMDANTFSILPCTIPPGMPTIGKNYRMKSVAFNVEANTTATTTFSFPYPIGVIGGVLQTDNTSTGDIVSIGAGYDTTMGTITQSITANSTVIYTQPAVFAFYYVRIGGNIRLTDGVNTTAYFSIVSIDYNANSITVDTPIPYNFAVSSPTTYVQLALIFADNIEIGPLLIPNRIGYNAFGATYVPANRVFRITYTNKSLLASKRPVFVYDYYY